MQAEADCGNQGEIFKCLLAHMMQCEAGCIRLTQLSGYAKKQGIFRM